MKQILPPHEFAQKLIRTQQNVSDPVRFSHYVLRVPCDEGELLYHDLTGELLLLPMGEDAMESRDELIRRRFLVPQGFDEYVYTQQVRQLAELLAKKRTAITKFVVFPTTDCNARCLYCYELGRRRENMSDTVAEDTAAYIIKKSGGAKVNIQWFGGEPLYNRRAIDVICNRLRDAGQPFHSIMVSNGYLFDEETVHTATEQWKLDFVQITLDGMEQIYNKTKAYIYEEGSAYQRVLRNIGLLLDAGVHVEVRLNMGRGNQNDLYALADALAERFAGQKGLTVYCVLLRNFFTDGRAWDGENSLGAYDALQKRLIELGFGKLMYLKREVAVNQCMADNDGSLTILPDGRIGKCEHESEQNLIGSIYSEEPDAAAVSAWKERIVIPECQDCLFAPTCIRLKQCPWHIAGCTERDRSEMRINLTQKVINTFEREKNAGKSFKPISKETPT